LKPKNLKPNWSAVDAPNEHDILRHHCEQMNTNVRDRSVTVMRRENGAVFDTLIIGNSVRVFSL